MAKNDKKVNRKKVEKQNCEVDKNCNVSDLTDSVEFASEPFNDTNENKCENNNCDDGGGC